MIGTLHARTRTSFSISSKEDDTRCRRHANRDQRERFATLSRSFCALLSSRAMVGRI
jgi:hypothetical protein